MEVNLTNYILCRGNFYIFILILEFTFTNYVSKFFTFFLKKDLNIVKFNIIISVTKDEGVFKMELTKNIFFNTDKLVENSKVKISYTGELFQNASTDVSIHYGFGANWDNINDAKMEKTELGFQIEVELISSDTFNFCFYNENNVWDNNSGNNYVFSIEKKPVELIVLDDEPVSLGNARKLRKSYIWSKKIRLAVYKIITYLPKIISGNYRKKSSNENN